MTAMIEKVARAIFAADWPKDDWGRFGEMDHVRERYRAMARAAIDAMREPTERMLAATEEVAVGYDDFATGDGTLFLSHPGFHDNAKTAWRVMIDAALEQCG